MTIKNFTPKSLFAFLIMVFLQVSIYGQTKVGTTVGQFLKIEPSARGAALGNAGTSLTGEATLAYYNPASLGRLPQSSVQFLYSKWLADISYNYAVAAIKIGTIGTFLLQITALNSGEIDVTTVDKPLGTGERYDVTNFAIGGGYGRMVTDRVAVGFQLNYLKERIWHSSLSSLGLNLGVQYQLNKNGATLGASFSNFGPRSRYSGTDIYIEYDQNRDIYGDNDQIPSQLQTESFGIPTLFRVGFSYPFLLNEANKFLLAVDAMHQNDNSESVNFGAEWTLFKTLSIRGGYRNLLLEDLEGGLVLGAGLNFRSASYFLSIDYAWADYGLLDYTQRFSLGLGF
ncbi:MAG: hypothetical protein A2Y94_00135 [Caldithrix sp. RBG_13_44_9]|nr:MAG: hypothetical protein A2Y94_00135 [Caldithrix sp. RBG_13_44_9]